MRMRRGTPVDRNVANGRLAAGIGARTAFELAADPRGGGKEIDCHRSNSDDYDEDACRPGSYFRGACHGRETTLRQKQFRRRARRLPRMISETSATIGHALAETFANPARRPGELRLRASMKEHLSNGD